MTTITHNEVRQYGSIRSGSSALIKCLIESRPAVQLIFFLRFASGAVLSGSQYDLPDLAHFLTGAAIWQCAIVFVYLFNGATDVVEDRINRVGRPIARGEISPAEALRWAGGFAVAAVAGAALLQPVLLVPVLGVLALGYVYSGAPFHAKRRPLATLVVATLGGLLTYYAGYLNSGGPHVELSLAVLAVAMSCWMGMVGATTKDFSDIQGDARAGSRSLSIVFGELRARAAVSLVALALAGTFLFCAVTVAPTLVWPAVVTALGAVAVAVLAVAGVSYGTRHRRRLPYRAFMVTQYGAHLALPVAVI